MDEKDAIEIIKRAYEDAKGSIFFRDELQAIDVLETYIKKSISKDKIKEKIGKIESSINNLFGSANYDDELMGQLQYSLDILQELLEEENK